MSIDTDSLRNWLASWGNGPHWADQSGLTVPVTKETFAKMLDEVDRLRAAIRWARGDVLSWNNTTSLTMARANLAAGLDQALDPATTTLPTERGGEE